MINQLTKQFDGQLGCLGENTEKYTIFSVLISKNLDNGTTITYKLKLIDSLVDNLSESYKNECKGCEERRKSNQYAILLGLKNNLITNVKNVKKDS